MANIEKWEHLCQKQMERALAGDQSAAEWVAKHLKPAQADMRIVDEPKKTTVAKQSDTLRTAAPLLLGAVEAARRLGISRSLFLSFYRQGIAPSPVRLGRRTVWRLADIEEWVASGCAGAQDATCRS